VTDLDFAALIEPVARHFWGHPNAALSKRSELRWGTRGSRSVDLKKGTWFDHEANEGGGTLALIMHATGWGKEDSIDWLKEEFTNGEAENITARSGSKKLGRIVATYRYDNEDGELLFEVVRFTPKSFAQRRPNGRGGWVWKLDGARRVLYRLPELIEGVAAGHPVIIVEGEKDANTLVRLGYIATTNPGGASKGKKPKWRPEYGEFLRGADVILVPDNDEPGWQHVHSIGASLTGVASRIRVLLLPNAKDVSDWVAAGGTREQFDALIEAAPLWVAPARENTKQDDAAKKDAATASEDQLLDELARLNRREYERRRRADADRLGMRRSALDREVEAGRAQMPVETPPLFGHWIVEPWPEPVDGDALILALVRRIQRHVVLSNEAALSVALWVLMAWVHEAVAVHSPILMVTSAEANSGKTTLLNLIGFLVPRALMCVEISEATLFRSLERWQPTILVDEADVILVENEPLRAVVNSGWTRGANVPRCIGEDKIPHAFPTFCPKVTGLKGRRLPDTTLSRSIIIELRRRKPTERVEHFRSIDDPELGELRRQCLRWANDTEGALEEALRTARPSMPPGFENRLGDNWELLFAIADHAGCRWPDQARDAASKLSAAAADTASIGTQLLADIREVFSDDDRLSTVELLQRLTADAERPWLEYSHGKPLTPRGLSRMLRPFGILSGTIRLGSGTPKGYYRVAFEDAWERYL
jgi:hypothetical protein